MSTKLMGMCWGLQMPPSAKAVLMSLADQANDDGVCWPSQASMMERTCLSDRAVRKALRWLESVLVLVTEGRADKRGRRTSNCYTIAPQNFCPEAASDGIGGASDDGGEGTDLAESANVGAEKVVVSVEVDGSPSARGAGGSIGTWCRIHRHVVPGHYIEPKGINTNTPQPPLRGAVVRDEVEEGVGSSSADGLIGLPRALELAKEAGEKFIEEDDPLIDFARVAGITGEQLRLCWAEFKARRHSKRQRGLRGWRQAFRDCVRGNWYRLWFIKPGMAECEYTTQGLQALAMLRAQQEAGGANGVRA